MVFGPSQGTFCECQLIKKSLGINLPIAHTSVTQKKRNCFRIVCVIISGLIVSSCGWSGVLVQFVVPFSFDGTAEPKEEMPEAGDEDAASSIEALLEENAVLRAENEALQEEAQRFGIDVDKLSVNGDKSRPDLVHMQDWLLQERKTTRDARRMRGIRSKR